MFAFHCRPRQQRFQQLGRGRRSWRSGNQAVASALRALERDGLIRTLAEPNLTAVSGEPAKFLAGGEFPIPVVDSLGQISVIFKEFGVGLAFTPVVLSEGRISLKIESEVSELTNDGAVVLSEHQIPALKKRQAKSTVELPSGGSLAIAGLISDDTRQNIDGFPGLKDVPMLGTLFRSRDFIKQETELVVIVTPYMVRPTARQNLARPLDGLATATDLQGQFPWPSQPRLRQGPRRCRSAISRATTGSSSNSRTSGRSIMRSPIAPRSRAPASWTGGSRSSRCRCIALALAGCKHYGRPGAQSRAGRSSTRAAPSDPGVAAAHDA